MTKKGDPVTYNFDSSKVIGRLGGVNSDGTVTIEITDPEIARTIADPSYCKTSIAFANIKMKNGRLIVTGRAWTNKIKLNDKQWMAIKLIGAKERVCWPRMGHLEIDGVTIHSATINWLLDRNLISSASEETGNIKTINGRKRAEKLTHLRITETGRRQRGY